MRAQILQVKLSVCYTEKVSLGSTYMGLDQH